MVPAQARRAEENNVENFEDLGVAPELAEALAAEGIETPTPIQRDAIPIIRKGNNLVLEAGPGSGGALIPNAPSEQRKYPRPSCMDN